MCEGCGGGDYECVMSFAVTISLLLLGGGGCCWFIIQSMHTIFFDFLLTNFYGQK